MPIRLAFASAIAIGASLSLASQVEAANLYITSFNNNSVLEFDAETGEFIDTFIESDSGGLQGPVGFAINPEDNNFYVTSLFFGARLPGFPFPPGRVLQYDGETGDFLQPFTSAVPSLFLPQDLAFGPDGNLYVANTSTDTIEQYDGRTGAYLGSLFPADEEFCDAPFSIASDGVSSLYFSCTFSNTVQRYDVETSLIEELGNASSADAGPGGLNVGPDGAVYVANFVANTIDRYNVETGLSEVFIDDIDSPVEPVFGPNGDLYVSSNPTQKVGPVPGKVLRYDGQTGILIDSEFISPLAGNLNGAGWIAFADSNTVSTPEPGLLLGLLTLGVSGITYRRYR